MKTLTKRASIIIRTRNEAKYLQTLFDGIEANLYPNSSYETIIVDSESTDDTVQIAKRLADKVIQIPRERFTFGYSLNVGISESKAEHIVIISAHCKPTTKDWLRDLLSPLQDETVAMVYGSQIGCKESKFSDAQDLMRRYTGERPYYFANNANSAIRKSLWEQHKFNETLSGLEDIEWAKYWSEHGFKTIYQASAEVQHCHTDTGKQTRNRFYREAKAARQLKINMYGYKDILKEFRFCFADLLSTPDITETILFRFNKVLGMLKGRMES